ncbi:membrane protein [soil metagenome]
MTQSVIGLVKTRPDAESLVVALKETGFADSQISVLFPDKEGSNDFAHDNSTKAPEGAVTGASTGGIIGGAVGLLAGIGALAIPGVGPLIAAGPIMATLSGLAVGATLGGVAGALVGMGIPEYEAKMFEGKLLEGNILIAAHSADGKDLERAEAAFKTHGATDVKRVHDAAVKA